MTNSENHKIPNPVFTNEEISTELSEEIQYPDNQESINPTFDAGTRIFQSTECTNTKSETLVSNSTTVQDDLDNIIKALDPSFEQAFLSPKVNQSTSNESKSQINPTKINQSTQISDEPTPQTIIEDKSINIQKPNLINSNIKQTKSNPINTDQATTQKRKETKITILTDNQNNPESSNKHHTKTNSKQKEPDYKNYELYFRSFEEEMNKSPSKQLLKPKEIQHKPKVNDITPSFYKRNNMFLTQIEEEAKLKKSTTPDFSDHYEDQQLNRFQMLQDVYQSVPDPYLKRDQIKPQKRANSIISMNRPKITQPYQQYSSSSLSHTKKSSLKTDYSKYDDDLFDWEEKQKKIPPKLLEMIIHSPQSIVFRALCGENVVQDIPKRVINSIIQDLKMYLNMCISNNLIGESSYVDCIISNIKIDLNQLNMKKSNEEEKIKQRLTKAENSFEERKQHWTEKKNILEVEFDLALEDLDLKNQEQISSLDDQWNSEKMQQRFNKPSAKLIELRQNAHALLAAHQFEDAEYVACQIEKLEEYETSEAAYKMQKEYKRAHETLQNKFESDKQAMKDSYETKMNGILASEASDLHPYEQRIDNLNKMKNNLQIEMKINAKNRKKEEEKKVPIIVKAPSLSPNAKLKLPPLRSLTTLKSNQRPTTYK